MERKVLAYVLVYLFLAVVFAFFVGPLLWLFLSAFDPNASPVFEIPSHFTLDNFKKLLVPVGNVIPLQWILNSLIISLSAATIATLVSVISAYVFARYTFKGQGAMLTTFVILRLVPPIVIALPIMMLYNWWGLINTYLGAILVIAALITPFALLIAESFFRSLPVEYEEAAMVDGCSRLGAFMRVTLHLAIPGITTIWLLSFVTAWSQFVIPLMILKNPALMPASVGLSYFFGEYGRVDYGRLSAFSLLFSLPVIIIFLSIQKYLRRGIAGLVSR